MANSPSHRFGQIIGDVLEEASVQSIRPVASKYNLYLDHKHPREARNWKREVVWKDIEGNNHKLDIVLEQDGSEAETGIPRAFIEIAWRRYTKHSKNKAQEIAGAIRPLVDRYRSASPFYGAIIAGVFTDNSIQQLKSEGFSVVYFDYCAMEKAFAKNGIDIKWDESTPDEVLQQRVNQYESLSATAKQKIIDDLLKVNAEQIQSFLNELSQSLERVISSVYVLPLFGKAHSFKDADSAAEFIQKFDEDTHSNEFVRYDIIVKYSNGDSINASFTKKSEVLSFLRSVSGNKEIHGQVSL